MKTKESMKEIIEKFGPSLIPFKAQDVIEVEVKNITKNNILVDVAGLKQGIIPEREWGQEVENLKIGDKILAYVILPEDEKGRVVLSLRRADKERLLKTLFSKFEKKETISTKVKEANKGGLICQIGNVEGFLPVSQLTPAHYPKVGGRKEEILAKLKKLIGKTLNVKIINFDKKTKVPIFSEKSALPLSPLKIKVGDIKEGEITGLVDFGIFVNLGEYEGLVHISEVAWSHVDNLAKLYKVGDKIKVKVINISDGKISLSLKRLKTSIFEKALSKYKEGEIVKVKVTKITPFGVFVKLDKDIEGRVLLSELSDKKIKNPSLLVKEGKKYQFKVIKISKKENKIDLSLKQARESKWK